MIHRCFSRLRAALLGSVCAVSLIGVTASPMLILGGVTAAPALLLTGCTQSQRNAAATLTTTLVTAAAQVATLEGQSDLAVKLKSDGAAVSTALTNWQTTHSGADAAIQFIGILEDDLGLIPGTSPYAPLIQIALATAQTLIALIPPSAVSPASTAVLQAHRMKAVHLGFPAPQTKDEFVQRWNDAVKANPQLAGASIK